MDPTSSRRCSSSVQCSPCSGCRRTSTTVSYRIVEGRGFISPGRMSTTSSSTSTSISRSSRADTTQCSSSHSISYVFARWRHTSVWGANVTFVISVFSARCNIYISRLCYTVSVCLWRKCIVVTVHAGKRRGSSRAMLATTRPSCISLIALILRFFL